MPSGCIENWPSILLQVNRVTIRKAASDGPWPAENIVFSDGLHIDKAIELARASKKAGIGCSMGVGTFFTNDFVKREQPDKSNAEGEGEAPAKDAPKSAPLNMWVLLECRWL